MQALIGLILGVVLVCTIVGGPIVLGVVCVESFSLPFVGVLFAVGILLLWREYRLGTRSSEWFGLCVIFWLIGMLGTLLYVDVWLRLGLHMPAWIFR